MFVVRRGSVKVIRRDEDGREAHLGTLREGDYFGELALITSKVRQASVVTLEECELLELRKQDLDEFTARYPRFAATLRAFAEARLKKGKG
jgi:CRP/FNR family cyclic AMP-dependent transcriptional regulator